jgi:hypothetical protein
MSFWAYWAVHSMKERRWLPQLWGLLRVEDFLKPSRAAMSCGFFNKKIIFNILWKIRIAVTGK